jgi:hypothetical protein
MKITPIDEVIELLEKANADLQPELLPASEARALFASYARAQRLVNFGIASLSRKVSDASEVATITGTSKGHAKSVVTTGKVLGESAELHAALQHGDISLEQAGEIAAAEESSPGAATELIAVAQRESFHVLKDRARKIKLEAEQHRDLAQRQHAARRATSHTDELGMVHIHLALEPHVGSPIVARAEAEAARLARKDRGEHAASATKPFEQHLADAYARMLQGSGKGRARRPELVVLVSHEVSKRGWQDVQEGEVCKIPGVGPIPPQIAKQIAGDAFLSGVFYDGTDLRHLKRWSRHTPLEVALALELGEPPSFDGIACVDCGNRFRTEFDHVQPHAALGPASYGNLKPRCWTCHQTKTARDRRDGRLKPPEP